MRAWKIVVAPLFVFTAITCAPPVSHAAYAIRRQVIGNGGTPSTGISGSSRKIFATAGQSAVGVSTGSGRDLCHGFWCWGGSSVVSVDPAPGELDALPKTLAFGTPRPNPAQNAARFAIDLPRAARIDLRVMDVQGRHVRVIESGERAAGFHAVSWDGRDEAGALVLAGVYYARLTVDGVAIGTRRIVMRR